VATEPAVTRLEKNQIGFVEVIMPGLAQVAPAFNLFFTTGIMAGLAGASVPLVFLISMVGVIATASAFAQFSGLYPSAGSFLTFIAKSMGSMWATTVGVIALLGYIIAFSGIYVFAGSYILQNVLGNPQTHVSALTALVTILYGVLVTVPVIVGLKFGVRTTLLLYAFEVVLLLTLSLTILARAHGLSGHPFTFSAGSGTKDVLIAFSLAILAFGGFEASAPLAEETRDPRRNVPRALIGTVIVSGLLYVLGSYALVSAFGAGNTGALAADPNPFHTAAKTFISFVAPLVTWIFLSSLTSSYIAANTETSRVIYGGARGGLWARALANVSPRWKTPWIAAIAFVAPSVIIGCVSLAFTDPGTAAGFLGTFGILGVVLMYIMMNAALVVEWFRRGASGSKRGHWFSWVVVPVVGIVVLGVPVWGDLRPGQPSPYKYLPWLTIALVAVGVLYMLYLKARRPQVLERAASLLEGGEEEETGGSEARAPSEERAA
jgi:amino acid transporter